MISKDERGTVCVCYLWERPRASYGHRIFGFFLPPPLYTESRFSGSVSFVPSFLLAGAVSRGRFI